MLKRKLHNPSLNNMYKFPQFTFVRLFFCNMELIRESESPTSKFLGYTDL